LEYLEYQNEKEGKKSISKKNTENFKSDLETMEHKVLKVKKIKTNIKEILADYKNRCNEEPSASLLD
jgi:hypothetical protein